MSTASKRIRDPAKKLRFAERFFAPASDYADDAVRVSTGLIQGKSDPAPLPK
jgi:hypothetical protein